VSLARKDEKAENHASNHFKTVEDMGLKLLLRGFLEWLYLHTKFYENLPSGSKAIRGGTQTYIH
jgi:hypothetical protein